MAVLFDFTQTRWVHIRILPESLVESVDQLADGIANKTVELHNPVCQPALGDGWGQEDLQEVIPVNRSSFASRRCRKVVPDRKLPMIKIGCLTFCFLSWG